MQKLVFMVRSFIEQNRRHASSVAFALGFIWDSLTLTRVDQLYDNIVLTFYVVVAIAGIAIHSGMQAGRLRTRAMERLAPWIPLIIQFAFGGLFSGYIIFYSRSASLVGSWPFLLFLAALFIGNEIFKKRYQVLAFQLSILFIALFSYSIFSIPVLLGSIGAGIFFLSGLVSIALLGAVLWGLSKIAPQRLAEAKRPLTLSIAGLYLLFNLAYVTNVIPPIPLALKELGIYHSVEPLPDGNYRLTFEPAPWYRFFDEADSTLHLTPGARVYAFSSIFAPTRLETTVVHRWSYFDTETNSWITASEIPFPLFGGRDNGYRGYSQKSSLFPGRWRVDVRTLGGQLIGRTTFRLETISESPPLRTVVK